jgi:hypothetical protein
MLRGLLFLVLILSAPGLGGCSGYRAPKVEVASVNVAEATSEGVVVEFILAAANDNEDPLPLKRIDYTLALDGKKVFSGVRSPEATLRSKGEQRIRVPAVVRIGPGEPAPTGTKEYTLSGRITYLEPGKIAELLFDTAVIQPSAGFSAKGSIVFPGS